MWSTTASVMAAQGADTPSPTRVSRSGEPEGGVAQPQQSHVEQKPIPPQDIEPGVVLVADDDAVNRTIAQGMLVALGYQVVLARDGAEAVTAIAMGDHYVAVLMDCHMPQLDGYAATRAIRALQQGANRRLPIIAFTASPNPHERQHCIAAGMDDFLAKPAQLDVLAVTLNRWTRHRLEVSAPQPLAQPTGSVLDPARLAMLHALKGDDLCRRTTCWTRSSSQHPEPSTASSPLEPAKTTTT